nr:ATP-binding protein [bacterium]
NRLRGILSFESLQVARRWSDDDRTLQRLTAELIGSVIRRLDAEYALIKNEAQYRQLFADALVAIFRSRIEDGEILQVNQAGAELLGKESPEKLLSDRFLVSELYPAPRRRELLDLLEKNEEIHNFEITMNPPGKNPIDISVSARIFPELGYIEGVMVDITDRNRAEAELKRLRLFMADIVNSLPSMVIGVNPAGLVTHWNRRASEMTGIPPAKARGSRIGDVLKDIPEIEALIRSVFTGGESCTTEVRVKVKGEYRNLDVKVLPLSSSEDSGAVIRVDDITDRRRMESMIVQSEKMLSIGGLAAGMAHEINNPLAAILQNLQVIRNRLFLDMERNEMVARECELDLHRMRRYLNRRNIDQMLESVMQSGHRASRIVDNMLSFSRKGDSRFTTTDIAALVDRTLELASNEYDLKKKYDFRKIRILKQYVENTPVVLCDPGQIQQVVFNILKNGAQAMATVSGKESEFLIRVYSENGWVVIAITDNGPGLEEAVRKRIFEPFFTTKEVGMGTGLGLSVSYYIIVENHRGELEVDSILGQGSTFYIRLPLEQTETQILRNVRRQTNA